MPDRTEEELTTLDLLAAAVRNRRALTTIVSTALLVGIVTAVAIPKTYTGTTRILPPQQGQSAAAAMLTQLGGAAAGLAGNALGVKNPSDLFIGLLRSETVADALVTKHDLQKVYDAALVTDARKILDRRSSFFADKAGIITVRVEDRDPSRAADLANAYIAELQRLTSTLAVTEASQRRLFFEQQLRQAKDTLADAEAALRLSIQEGGIINVDAQSRAAVETVGRLRAQISAKEVQLGAMRAYATGQNPDLQRLDEELSSMRRELERLESGERVAASGDSKGSARGIDSVRLLREVKYQEVLFELLAKQYEMARVDEAKQAPLIQVIDVARPPERKSGPQRSLVVAGSLFVGLLLAIGWVILKEWWSKVREEPHGATIATELRRLLGRHGP